MYNFDLFINKNDLLKIDMMNYILETNQPLYEMKDLEQNFSISNYLLKSTVESLNIDLSNLFEFDCLFIQKGIIYQKRNITRYHMYKLSQFYFELSPLKIILEKRIIKGELPSYTNMQVEYGWSTSYFFANRNMLTDMIKYDNLVDFVYASYSIYSYFDAKPNFSERVNEVSQDITQFLLSNAVIDERSYEQKELIISIFTSEIMNNGFDGLPKQYIQTTLVLPDNIPADFNRTALPVLLEILDGFDFLQENGFYWYNDGIQCEILRIQKKIIPVLSKFFSEASISEISLLSYNIAKYSQRFTVKSEWFFQREGHVNLSYYRDIYPSIFCLMPNLLDAINYYYEIVSNEQKNLFQFNIIGIMFDIIKTSKIDRIQVSVNFTATQLTNNMIMSMLKSHINHASVDFTQNIDDANIYLSDTINDNVVGEQVIWKKPPSISDWNALGELIVKIKQNEKRT